MDKDDPVVPPPPRGPPRAADGVYELHDGRLAGQYRPEKEDANGQAGCSPPPARP